MFNTEFSIQTNDNHQSINIDNPSTGQLVKLSKTSKIARFSKGSDKEKQFFCDEPYIVKTRTVWYDDTHSPMSYYEVDDYYDIDILQVVIFGNNQYLVEYEIKEKQS